MKFLKNKENNNYKFKKFPKYLENKIRRVNRKN